MSWLWPFTLCRSHRSRHGVSRKSIWRLMQENWFTVAFFYTTADIYCVERRQGLTMFTGRLETSDVKDSNIFKNVYKMYKYKQSKKNKCFIPVATANHFLTVHRKYCLLWFALHHCQSGTTAPGGVGLWGVTLFPGAHRCSTPFPDLTQQQHFLSSTSVSGEI